MRAAGRDGTRLFSNYFSLELAHNFFGFMPNLSIFTYNCLSTTVLTHQWVNYDYMLDGCMIGHLIPEHNDGGGSRGGLTVLN